MNIGVRPFFSRAAQKAFTANVADLYQAGAIRNIASFYVDVTAGRFENPTVRRAVDGCLTCILGREAGFRHGRLTMEELLKENRRRRAGLERTEGLMLVMPPPAASGRGFPALRRPCDGADWANLAGYS